MDRCKKINWQARFDNSNTCIPLGIGEWRRGVGGVVILFIYSVFIVQWLITIYNIMIIIRFIIVQLVSDHLIKSGQPPIRARSCCVTYNK